MQVNADGRYSGVGYWVLDGNAIPAQVRLSILGAQKINASIAMLPM